MDPLSDQVNFLGEFRTRKLFIWQVQVQSYDKSGRKHNIIELYKYGQETEVGMLVGHGCYSY